jgi:hypothetical protein
LIIGDNYLNGSISRIKIQFIVEDVGNANGELIRFLAPRTIDALLRSMPLNGITSMGQDMVYFKAPINIGAEKSKSQFDLGSITYWPMGSSICIFLNASKSYSPMNIIGKISNNLEIFQKISSGKRIKLEKT